jgi:glycosyltransferase involved in cell wall biosynthesis
MMVTIILCTYNRCQLLKRALVSLMAIVLPENVEWELLVVDNNSSDQSRQTVADFENRYPRRVRYLFEGKPGKSHALNAGVAEARGDVLVFTDDDITVQPTWLQNLTSSLTDAHWAGAGGPVLRDWNNLTPPRWLSADEFGSGPLVMFDCGHVAGLLKVAPIGANMAFRKSMFVKYGGFRTDLGPRPGNEIRSEDVEFGCRLMAAGERLRYEPSAAVYHPVEQKRLDKRYFLKWSFDLGRGSVRQYGRGPDICGIPRPYLSIAKQAGLITSNMLNWTFSVRPDRRFLSKMLVWKSVGSIAEFCTQLLQTPPKAAVTSAPEPSATSV